LRLEFDGVGEPDKNSEEEGDMRFDRLLISKCCACRLPAALCLLIAVASSPALLATGVQITKLAYPKATATYASAVNVNKAVVGFYTSSKNTTVGFVLSDKTYKPISFNSTTTFTRALGINDSAEIVGDFLGSDGYYHGFTYIKGTLTQYDAPGGLGVFSTSIFGVDNNGDFAGAAGAQGFVSIGGTVTLFYGSGTDLTYALGINDSGVAVGQYFDSSNLSHGFMWQNGTSTEITYPGATQTACEGINNAGEITGYYIDSKNQPHGFTYSAGVFSSSELTFIGGVNTDGDYVGSYVGPPGVTYAYLAIPISFKPGSIAIKDAASTSTVAVNNAGVLVGQYTNSTGDTYGMMLDGTTLTRIDDPKGVAGSTWCYGINNNNDVVGFYTSISTGQQVGFYYAGGTFTDIPGPSTAVSTEATGINDGGQIVGYFLDASNNEHGFILSGPGGTYTQLDVPEGTSTYAYAINNAGTVTVGYFDSAGYSEAALYSGTTYTTVDLPGSSDFVIHGINNDGDVVYITIDGDGNYHGGLLSGGLYYLLDVNSGTNTHADGINDSGLIVGRYNPTGSANFKGFDGKK
jgi:probable HAF family extracellular repeat protein